jgi:hypothetical protein
VRIISALSDRLVHLLVPSTTASADCGVCYWDGRSCGPGQQGSIICCPNTADPLCRQSCWCVM